MRSFLLLCVSFLTFTTLHAQQHAWSFSFGSTQFERAEGLALDTEGNVYVCGVFDGEMDIDPDTLATTIMEDSGNGDVYLAKYSNSGDLIWALDLGDWGHDLGSDVEVDAEGNVYLTGYFRVEVDFDPGEGEAILSAQGTRDIFVAKYDTDGNYLWAFNTAPGGNVERYPAIGLDAEGNVLLTGDFMGTWDFDPGPGVTTITSNGDQDIFVSKYTTDGAFLWARAMGGDEFDRGMDVAADADGGVYVTGMFRRTAQIDGTSATITSRGGWDSFLLKYDALGAYQWSFGFGGSGNSDPVDEESGMDLAIDADNNVLLTGFYSGNTDMDPSKAEAVLTVGAETNSYVAKYSSGGEHLWSFGVADNGEGQGNAIAVDAAGKVYVTGYFDGIADFDPGPGEALLVGWDVFTAKYDRDGNYQWAFRAGDTAADAGWGIAVDDSANVYTTGVFFGNMDMDPGPEESILVSEGGRDVYVAKYAPCYRAIESASICPGDSYVLPDGSMTSASVVYPSTFMGAGGCDSVIVTVLDVVAIDTAVALNGVELIVEQAGAIYQWLDCSNGMEPIDGADMQSYAPVVEGEYAVDVTVDACTVRSICHVVLSTGIEARMVDRPALVPNPTNGVVRITGVTAGQRLSLWNCLGEGMPIQQGQEVLDLSELPAGVYFLRVEQGAQILGTLRLLKQ